MLRLSLRMNAEFVTHGQCMISFIPFERILPAKSAVFQYIASWRFVVRRQSSHGLLRLTLLEDGFKEEPKHREAIPKYSLPHMRTNVMQGMKPLEGHNAWHELVVGCTKYDHETNAEILDNHREKSS